MMKYRGFRKPARRLAGVAAVLAAALALAACSARPTPDSRPLGPPTYTFLTYMPKPTAGDRLRVESITSPGEEIHDYQPSPEDIRRGADADLVIQNGLGLERWFEKFTSQSGAETVVASKGVAPIPIAEGDHKGEPNPHAWMSPKNAKVYVDNMVAAFSKLDPSHAKEFEANGKAYKAKLDAIANDMQKKLASVPQEQRALVTCEGAFSYLTRDYGLAEHYLWGVNAEGAMTPKRVAAVQDTVKKNRIPAVFCESTVEGKMDAVVQATGAKYGGTLYVDSLTDAKGPAPTYLDLLEYDTKTIASGLAGGSA